MKISKLSSEGKDFIRVCLDDEHFQTLGSNREGRDKGEEKTLINSHSS
jgi:uncharacterized protein (DUF736 family)